MSTHRLQLLITDDQKAWLESQSDQLRNKSAVIRDLIDSARLGVDKGVTLGLASEAKQVPLPSSIPSKEVKKKVIKSLPPSLQAHEDLIKAFWKTKQGSKSDAGWKLLMTELGKIQDAYGDRVVREQLELAAANRWKGVSLKNYEQFGLNAKSSSKGSGIDWSMWEGVSL